MFAKSRTCFNVCSLYFAAPLLEHFTLQVMDLYGFMMIHAGFLFRKKAPSGLCMVTPEVGVEPLAGRTVNLSDDVRSQK